MFAVGETFFKANFVGLGHFAMKLIRCENVIKLLSLESSAEEEDTMRKMMREISAGKSRMSFERAISDL